MPEELPSFQARGGGLGNQTGSGTGTGERAGAGSAGGQLTPPEPLGNYARMKIPYTAAATNHKLTGVVHVRLSLYATGRVTAVRLVSGVGYGMDARALALAKNQRFKPAKNPEGEPIPCQIDWRFTLNG